MGQKRRLRTAGGPRCEEQSRGFSEVHVGGGNWVVGSELRQLDSYWHIGKVTIDQQRRGVIGGEMVDEDLVEISIADQQSRISQFDDATEAVATEVGIDWG